MVMKSATVYKSLFLLFATCSLLAAQNSPTLYKKAASIETQDSLTGRFSVWPYLHFVNGKYVGFDKLQQRVAIASADGATEKIFDLRIPEAAEVGVYDVTLEPNGSAIAAGYAVKENGARARFVAAFSSTGGLQRIMRTDEFMPYHVCSVQRGSVWVLGRDMKEESKPAPVPSYNVLRAYNLERGLLESSFDKALITEGFLHPGSMHLACTQDAAFAYFQNTGTVLMYRFKDHSVQQWKGILAPLGSYEVTGFAVSDARTLYLSMTKLEGDLKAPTFVSNVFSMELPQNSSQAKGSVLLDEKGASLATNRARVVGVRGNGILLRQGPDEIVAARY